LSLLLRLLQLMPMVRQLEKERDTLRSEQNSIKLKLRAASAEMGVLEEQCRVLENERGRLADEVARRKSDYDQQAARLTMALASGESLAKERDALVQERRTVAAQSEAARAERERTANMSNNRRQKTGPG